MSQSKYTSHVLLDNDDKIVEQFKIDDILTQLVIEKTRTFCFNVTGLNACADKLVAELTVIININQAAITF